MSQSSREQAWPRALELARSGRYKRASHVEDILRTEGHSREVNRWRDSWEHDRLDLLCRDAIEGDSNA